MLGVILARTRLWKQACGEENEAWRKMFHMCWAPSDGSSKLIPIDEQPKHQIVHLFRLGKAQGATHKPLHPGPEIADSPGFRGKITSL